MSGPTTPTPAVKKDPLRLAVELLGEARKRPTLLYRGSITDESVDHLYRLLRDKQFPELDVIMDSGGGDPHAAFQLCNILRRHSRRCTMMVVDWAKSAATLIALGMDEIILTETGQLGPLDTQIESRSDRDSVRMRSAMEVTRAMRETRQASLMMWQLAGQLIEEEEGLTTHGAYSLAGEFVGKIAHAHLSPLQMDHYGQSVRALGITTDYAVRILKRYRGLGDQEATRVANHLVQSYAAHSFVIDAEELEVLGLCGKLVAGELRPLLDTVWEALKLGGSPSSKQPRIELWELPAVSVEKKPLELLDPPSTGIVETEAELSRNHAPG